MVSPPRLLLNKGKNLQANDKLLLQLQFITETVIRIFDPLQEDNENVYGYGEKQLQGSIKGNFSIYCTMSYNFTGEGLMLSCHVLLLWIYSVLPVEFQISSY